MAPPSFRETTSAAGPYSVCLPGHLELDTNDFNRICGVHPTDFGDGSYIVDFQSWKDAARYVKLAKKAKSEALECPPGLYQRPAASCTLKSPPGLSPTAPATSTTGHVVEVISLPKHLMSRKMLEAALEQAGVAAQQTGLDQEIMDITFLGDSKVKITLRSERAADICQQHFDGRTWNGAKGGAVRARVVTESSTRPHKSAPARPSFPSARGLNKISEYQPAYVHLPNPNRSRLGTSDVSTTVSDEDNDQEADWEADLRKVISGSFDSSTT